MRNVLVAGAGKIGSLISCLLATAGDYEVYLGDLSFEGADARSLLGNTPHFQTVPLDVNDPASFVDFIQRENISAVISALPYYLNPSVAQIAKDTNIPYFDLTEDRRSTEKVGQIAENAATPFVPQCGLAPGFISIVANSLMQDFTTLDTVKLRVGALPQNSSNALQYALTWSTDGVINEYGNPCHGIKDGKPVVLHPLEGLESIQLDGLSYEAFNTSGGLGSLDKLYEGKVDCMNYKTIRYPGHCEKMRVLMNDLKLNHDREMLKKILERAIPKTHQDVVIVYVSVTGQRDNHLIEENYLNKIYPQEIAGRKWSAIQVTTAAGITSVFDLVMGSLQSYRGLVLQERFTLDAILNNRFGRYFQVSGRV